MSADAPGIAIRPPHRQPTLIGLVLLGGSLGTAAREALVLTLPSLGSFPLAVFIINVAGSFALGVLLEGLVSGRSRTRRALSIRLLAGTGFLGGFTTYSALATSTDLLLRAGEVGVGVLYACGSLVLGLAAAGAGVAIAGSLSRRSAAGGSI